MKSPVWQVPSLDYMLRLFTVWKNSKQFLNLLSQLQTPVNWVSNVISYGRYNMMQFISGACVFLETPSPLSDCYCNKLTESGSTNFCCRVLPIFKMKHCTFSSKFPLHRPYAWMQLAPQLYNFDISAPPSEISNYFLSPADRFQLFFSSLEFHSRFNCFTFVCLRDKTWEESLFNYTEKSDHLLGFPGRCHKQEKTSVKDLLLF
jgi:hypothetical protein